MISLPAILELPDLRVKTTTRERTERGVAKVIRRLRPDWPMEDIILRAFGEGVYGGYAHTNEDIVIVRLDREDEGDKVSSIINTALENVELGLNTSNSS